MIIQSLTTALSTGLGCGTCCGSGVNAFLFGYLSTHSGSIKRSFRAFLSFYLGKILAVAMVCMACSILGQQLLDEEGKIGGIHIHMIVNILMIAMGVWFIIQWIRERLHPGCSGCHHCASPADPEELQKKSRVSYPALAVMGAGYGISPCAPLLMMAGYAVTLSPASAFLTGCVFAAASAFVPMILLMFLTGILSSRIYKEIPQYLGIFRLISYILLIVIFAVTL